MGVLTGGGGKLSLNPTSSETNFTLLPKGQVFSESCGGCCLFDRFRFPGGVFTMMNGVPAAFLFILHVTRGTNRTCTENNDPATKLVGHDLSVKNRTETRQYIGIDESRTSSHAEKRVKPGDSHCCYGVARRDAVVKAERVKGSHRECESGKAVA